MNTLQFTYDTKIFLPSFYFGLFWCKEGLKFLFCHLSVFPMVFSLLYQYWENSTYFRLLLLVNYVFPWIFRILFSMIFYSFKCSLVYSKFSDFLFSFWWKPPSSNKILHGNLIHKNEKVEWFKWIGVG